MGNGAALSRQCSRPSSTLPNMSGGIAMLTWFYNQRAGAENLIKEAKNDAGMADHPSGRWAMNCIFFQLAMLAYNLNCWLMLFNREEEATVETLGHTTLATARLRSCSWRRASGAMPDESASAIATTMPSSPFLIV